MTGIASGNVTPIHITKSDSLQNRKVCSFKKPFVLFFFKSFPLPLTSAFPPKAFPPLKPGAKMNTNKNLEVQLCCIRYCKLHKAWLK